MIYDNIAGFDQENNRIIFHNTTLRAFYEKPTASRMNLKGNIGHHLEGSILFEDEMFENATLKQVMANLQDRLKHIKKIAFDSPKGIIAENITIAKIEILGISCHDGKAFMDMYLIYNFNSKD